MTRVSQEMTQLLLSQPGNDPYEAFRLHTGHFVLDSLFLSGSHILSINNNNIPRLSPYTKEG